MLLLTLSRATLLPAQSRLVLSRSASTHCCAQADAPGPSDFCSLMAYNCLMKTVASLG